ncbi:MULTISPECIES: head maturation protease, ClpP-related [unclassified Dietzia]|uniref:head maturation protease, ClpP-related n=1 Tax=unclassified Dietzia TaxID=2617939 RepID=UPI0015F79931|nr:MULTISPECIES: head maturation protease, ClpP-related [unclassified Dietzia]MBB1022957.1 Clp protease ClpP [Dietzia sp. DQ12-76]MBB1026463.1 Clp protease ClpP [Dietzia sp. DQ11-38-2]
MNPFLTGRGARAEVRAAVSDDVATIRLYDPIDSWGGFWGVSSKEFTAALDELGEVSEITLLINCPGGEVWEAMSIYNSLRSHPARVTVIVEGLAASAASFIAMAGDEVIMRPASELMIHDAWIVGMGNADELRALADRIDSESAMVAAIYAEKAGTPVDMWREAMRSEQWFTPAEALEAGLIDAVSAGKPDRSESASVNRFNLASFNYAGRREAPAPTVAAARQEEDTMGALMAGLRERLGIAEDVTEEEALAALDEALAEQAGDPDPAGDDEEAGANDGGNRSTDGENLDGGDSGEGEGAPESSSAAAGADTVTLDAEVYADLLARAESGDRAQDAVDRAAAEAAVDAAVDAGKILAARRDDWVANYLEAPTDTADRIAALASGRINRAEQGHTKTPGQAGQSGQNSDLDARAKSISFADAVKL